LDQQGQSGKSETTLAPVGFAFRWHHGQPGQRFDERIEVDVAESRNQELALDEVLVLQERLVHGLELPFLPAK
jgi:hypothetical protein